MKGKVSRETRIEVAFTKALNGLTLANNGIRELKACLDEVRPLCNLCGAVMEIKLDRWCCPNCKSTIVEEVLNGR